MQINLSTNYGINGIGKINNKQNIRYSNSLSKDTFQRSNVSFGWCEPHVRRGSEISQIFNETLKAQKRAQELQQKAGELLDVANRSAMEATKTIINFANRMKGEAEFVPLWTIKSSQELQQTLDSSPIFGDPVQALIGIKNIGKFKMNNPKYSAELNDQGAGSLQVHTTIILAEQAERNLEKSKLSAEDKQEVTEMIKIVKNRINEVFGEGTYDKLIQISNMGKEPTLEQKQESNRILKEIDSKAHNFNFGEEFTKRLEALVDKQHEQFHHEHEHVHHHHDHVHETVAPTIEILYHTHGPNGEHEHIHEHEHEHVHEHEHEHHHH